MLVSIVLGVIVALLIFLLIPLTQMGEVSPKATDTLEELAAAVLPPPPPPSDPPPPPPEPEEETPPELDTKPPMPTLEQMELSLNPGTGGDLSLGLGVDLNFQTESAEQMMDLFGFDELDEIPHVIRRGRDNYPQKLYRRGVEGYVELLIFIDPSGRVEVREVLGYSHREFIAPAKSGAASTRFSPPMRNGQPVRAQYSWKIEFKKDR